MSLSIYAALTELDGFRLSKLARIRDNNVMQDGIL